MVALVAAETVLLVLLLVLVAGLLRSHAEILRRLGAPVDGGADVAGGRAVGMPAPPAGPPGSREVRAAPIAGATPEGDAVSLDFRGTAGAPTLLAFLSSGCSSCRVFWEALGERRVDAGVQTVIVTRSPDRESHARLRALGPAEVPVVMSSQAWKDYRVPGLAVLRARRPRDPR